MSENEIPENLIPIEDFSKKSGLSESRIVTRIRNGVYSGQLVDKKWYVDKAFLELEQSSDEVSSSSVADSNLSTRIKQAQENIGSSKYKTTRILTILFTVLGWITVVVGIFALFSSIGKKAEALEIMNNFSTMLTGLFLVAISQVVTALVDGADYAREILKVLKSNQSIANPTRQKD